MLTSSEANRNQSLSSSTLLSQDDSYDNIDYKKLYECVLKLLLLEYCNEARFKTPIVDDSLDTNSRSNSGLSSSGGNGQGSGSSGSGSTQSPAKRKSRIYGFDSSGEAKLSSSVYSNLEQHLNLIAMKRRGTNLDANTRRSLLRFYSEMLDPKFKADLKSNNSPDYLLMRFVSAANKEITKLGGFKLSEISTIVFKQATEFVKILIELVQKEKNSDLIITKLNEHKDSLNPQRPSISHASSFSSNSSLSAPTNSNVKYNKPSFRLSDMDQAMVELIKQLFHVESVKMQQDAFRLKDLAQEKTLHSDIKQLIFYLDKDLGQFVPKSFVNQSIYNDWKAKEKQGCELLTNKYQIPASMKLLPIPRLPSGEDFYVLPTSSMVRKYFVVLVKLCLELQSKERRLEPDMPLFSKQANNLINLAARVWRIDFPTKAVCVYTAAHLSGILRDNLYPVKDPKDLAPVDIDNSIQVFNYCRIIIEDQGKLPWARKDLWSFKDQEEWVRNLTYSYNLTMFAIKESLLLLFSKLTKPKFGPILMLLGEHLEADALFSQVEQSGLNKKWEKKLSKALLRTAESRYAELLENLPRDNTLSIIHVLDITDNIITDLRALQKRYKNPLLGFLHVPRTVAVVITAMIAVDSKNILKHIEAYSQKKGEFVAYGDSLEAYKSLCEIRDIYNQVNTTSSPFKFNLEKFFFPSLNEWVNESGGKLMTIVDQAIKNDNFEPINVEDDNKKFSTSVLDIFTLVKEFLKILEGLNWGNEYQLAKIYTILLKSISEGVLKYCSSITDKIIFELNEEEQRKLLEISQNKAERHNKTRGGWFDEMKNVVNNIQIPGSKIEMEEPYNFQPQTCVALNNLAAMLQQLTQLEDILDPEMILNTVKRYEPNRQNYFTSHVFSLRLVRAENLASGGGSSSSNIRPYVTFTDTMARKTIIKSRTINNSSNPDWDEEFELTLAPNSNLTVSVTVWDEKLGTHSICGRAMLQLDPKRFKHDGIPQEILLDLDSQGRLLIEVAVESERVDAIFVMGRAHRTLMRSQERCIKLIVEKFSRFIHLCFSRSNLKSICGGNGNIKPTQDQMDEAMMPLYDYLNSNLRVLAGYLTKDLLLKVMLAAWQVIVSSADQLLLPKLLSAKTFHLSALGSKLSSHSNHNSHGNNGKSGNSSNSGASGWQSAVSSAVANVTSSIGISGFGKLLTNNELETVFSWLNFLCFDFFHNDGNGPPIKDLKNENYQALLLLPVYYDHDIDYLKQEVERLSPAFIKSLRDRNNFESGGKLGYSASNDDFKENDSSNIAGNINCKPGGRPRSLSRAGTVARNNTITANATAKAREKARREAMEARSDPIAAQTSAEDIILRLLLIKDEKSFVARRLEQREKLAHSIATERLARAAAEGKFSRT